ncbi:MAG TPA: hypothetical protein VFS08_06870, partial [Gemmatimonadaceae bacterium]|nr:hypothetical protein [Gemmatimonadaceae bacterium]
MAEQRDRTPRDDGADDRPSQQGPRRQELIDQQAAERSRDSLGGAAPYQAQPERDLAERARVTETGTAARAEEAAGEAADPYHHDD